MSVENSARKPGDEWRAIVRKNGSKDFGAAFVAEPVLYASVLNGPCVGVDAIAAFFAATTAGMYESLVFTNETVDGLKTYLEWEGKAFGKDVGGTTVLTRNEAGLIQSVAFTTGPSKSSCCSQPSSPNACRAKSIRVCSAPRVERTASDATILGAKDKKPSQLRRTR